MSWKFVLGSLVAISAAVVYYLNAGGGDGWSDHGQELVFYDVSRGDLPIVVTERGYLESQEQTSIRCAVENYDRRSGSSGTTILSIVPNGSVVKKGDVLVELDSASIRDLLESESLELQGDKSSLIQAEARKENQLTQNETAVAEAKLTLKLAELNRKMYVDEESGTFKLSLGEIDRQIDESRNAILEAQAALKLQETERDGIEQLFRLGYKGKSDLEQSRYSFMKSEAALASAMNRLANHDATRDQLETYKREMELMKLDGEVDTAQRKLKQVRVTNESELAQVNAQLFEARERVQRQEARLAAYQRQLDNCTIRAPHDGMVVYSQDSRGNSSIAVGQAVRSRQELLTLPDLTRMQVRLQIHEAVLDQVKPGLPALLKIDAFQNTPYEGIVEHVAVVPSASSKSVKTYECIVRIPGVVQKLKPGMTAVSEIHIDRLEDVVSVPVQAVVQVNDSTWCYVDNGDGIEKRFVQLGRNNDKFVQIVDGLESDDRAVLNPMVIASMEKESGGQSSREPEDVENEVVFGNLYPAAETVAGDSPIAKVSTVESKPKRAGDKTLGAERVDVLPAS
ncbi:efflux RND transporter periplasmic adaptor subunit [Mariniblastus fucicola]|uniref:Macrolide export protein MacA n=1 Tax=Mariniblastus fucicola TaxID=980251 RepID=A0A5B9P6K8_9BACT|nr:efflux RND transporter periplasmic adaptor subunit [Mariniblastus fucicola]QEG20642.1 Macrolide export protein MacA [Mariniblastus fucicola]